MLGEGTRKDGFGTHLQMFLHSILRDFFFTARVHAPDGPFRARLDVARVVFPQHGVFTVLAHDLSTPACVCEVALQLLARHVLLASGVGAFHGGELTVGRVCI